MPTDSSVFDDVNSPNGISTPAYQEKKDQVQEILQEKQDYAQQYTMSSRPESSIQERTDARYQQLQDLAFEQDIRLKGAAFNRLFLFLALETVIVFVMCALQALDAWGFRLEEWSFRLLLTSTITQITVMLTVAVKSLFPEK